VFHEFIKAVVYDKLPGDAVGVSLPVAVIISNARVCWLVPFIMLPALQQSRIMRVSASASLSGEVAAIQFALGG
jgi:hypothetical protein